MIFGTLGANMDDAKGLYICSIIVHLTEGCTEKTHVRRVIQDKIAIFSHFIPLGQIHWVSRILALWLLPSDMNEAALILDTRSILFVLLAPRACDPYRRTHFCWTLAFGS
jgi:hypothetical protein